MLILLTIRKSYPRYTMAIFVPRASLRAAHVRDERPLQAAYHPALMSRWTDTISGGSEQSIARNIDNMRVTGLRQVDKLRPAGHDAPNSASRSHVITSVDPRGVRVLALRPASCPGSLKIIYILPVPLNCKVFNPAGLLGQQE